MWQITWILSLLPDWVWPALLIIGVLALLAAWVLGFVPFVKNYRLPIQVGGIIATVVAVWFLGAASNEEKWQAKIKEMEEKVELAEEQATNKNIEIQEKIVTKTKIVKEKGKDIVQYIDREIVKKEEIVKYIEQCPVPKEIIDLHNQATELNKAAEVKK
jgi:gas vesicle protein